MTRRSAPRRVKATSCASNQGACPKCHGVGRGYEVTETSLVPDALRCIRVRAIAAWLSAWHGQKLRDICVTLGFDIVAPWKSLRRYGFHTVAQTSSPHLKRRAHEHIISRGCALCRGRRLRRRFPCRVSTRSTYRGRAGDGPRRAGLRTHCACRER